LQRLTLCHTLANNPMEDIELILVNISGADRPGVTSALTDILARHEASILDIGQADIHHSLSLGILFRTS